MLYFVHFLHKFVSNSVKSLFWPLFIPHNRRAIDNIREVPYSIPEGISNRTLRDDNVQFLFHRLYKIIVEL